MVPKISAQLFSQSLLTGTFALISIGNAIASEIPTVQVSAVDRQSELLADSTDDSIAKIGGIYQHLDRIAIYSLPKLPMLNWK